MRKEVLIVNIMAYLRTEIGLPGGYKSGLSKPRRNGQWDPSAEQTTGGVTCSDMRKKQVGLIIRGRKTVHVAVSAFGMTSDALSPAQD